MAGGNFLEPGGVSSILARNAADDFPGRAHATSNSDAVIAALKTALPYVEKIAATEPFEMNRKQRQLQAVKDAAAIRKALAGGGVL